MFVQAKLYSAFVDTDDGRHALHLADRKTGSSSGDEVAATTTATTRMHGFQSMKYLLSVCNHPSLVLQSPGHPLSEWTSERLATGEWGTTSLQSVELSGKLVALRQLLYNCGFGGGVQKSTTSAAGTNSASNSNNAGAAFMQEDLLSQHRALIFFQTKKMLSFVARLLE